MNSILPQLSLKDGLDIWNGRKLTDSAETGEHLSAAELLRYTQPGGMSNAAWQRKEHLADCPLCLNKWLDICEEQSIVEQWAEEKSSDDWFSGGMMEAAAGEIGSSLLLKSRCGRFHLNLFPDADKVGEGMIALEYVGSKEQGIDGRWVTVKDRLGRILLDGSIRAGRIATISKDFGTMDLQAWSVHIHGDTNKGGGE